MRSYQKKKEELAKEPEVVARGYPDGVRDCPDWLEVLWASLKSRCTDQGD